MFVYVSRPSLFLQDANTCQGASDGTDVKKIIIDPLNLKQKSEFMRHVSRAHKAMGSAWYFGQ